MPKLPFDLRHCLDLARQFDDSARELVMHRFPYYIEVSQVNSAFACELYFKCLLNIKGLTIKGHDLLKLFNMLEQEEKEILEKIHDDIQMSGTPQLYFSDESTHRMEIIKILSMCQARTFLRIRYGHEDKSFNNVGEGEINSVAQEDISYRRLLFSVNATLQRRIYDLRPDMSSPHYPEIQGVCLMPKLTETM